MRAGGITGRAGDVVADGTRNPTRRRVRAAARVRLRAGLRHAGAVAPPSLTGPRASAGHRLTGRAAALPRAHRDGIPRAGGVAGARLRAAHAAGRALDLARHADVLAAASGPRRELTGGLANTRLDPASPAGLSLHRPWQAGTGFDPTRSADRPRAGVAAFATRAPRAARFARGAAPEAGAAAAFQARVAAAARAAGLARSPAGRAYRRAADQDPRAGVALAAELAVLPTGRGRSCVGARVDPRRVSRVDAVGAAVPRIDLSPVDRSAGVGARVGAPRRPRDVVGAPDAEQERERETPQQGMQSSTPSTVIRSYRPLLQVVRHCQVSVSRTKVGT